MSHPKTFLFTDLENSTKLWERDAKEMDPLMARHDAILTDVILKSNGQIVKTTGDGFHAMFDSAHESIAAALEGQRQLYALTVPDSQIPIKVRMGLHTGESEARNGDFFGPTVNRAARMMDIAHGGQILASGVTAALAKDSLPAEVTLLDKGQHRLKGIASLEHVYQIAGPDLPTEFPPLRSLAMFKHNLPRQLTSFIGRENELVNIKRLLMETRLLTLLGPGGTGKTRLMLQAAEEAIDLYPDGVWMVELAPLTNPNKIPDRVAAALNLQEQPERAIIETLFDYLRQKELLLLLDNVEHLIRECAIFVEELLERCPDVSVLVTGREALFIAGETTLQIPSLSLPINLKQLSLEEVRQSEGVQLFLERACTIRPEFEVSEQNAATIVDIVKRLDGIPLALELAAARLRMLTVEQISERLNDRFRLLTGGHRTALPRQQTLQALIDWSWNLLEEDEHVLLRRLSVFSGGWSLSVAQEVVGFDPLDEFSVFELLEQLINKSVVNVEYPTEGKARYSLLESIRQYARDKLFEAGEGETLRNRHADYYVRFAEESEPHYVRADMMKWVKRIEQELENFRAAITCSLEKHPELALRISGSLLYKQGHWIQYSEAKSWLNAAISKNRESFENGDPKVPPEYFVKGLIGLATVYSIYSDHPPAMKLINEAFQLSETHQLWRHHVRAIIMKTVVLANGAGTPTTPEWLQQIEKALALTIEHNYEVERAYLEYLMAYVHAWANEFEKAMPYYKKALELSAEINNPFLNGEVYRAQAQLAILQGDLDLAAEAFQKASDNFSAINDKRFALISQSDKAHILRRAGRIEDAIPIYREAILKWQEQTNVAALAHQLECFAFMAISKGQYETAAKMLGKARETRLTQASENTNELEIEELAQALDKLAEELGEAGRDTSMQEGENFSLDEAVRFALEQFT